MHVTLSIFPRCSLVIIFLTLFLDVSSRLSSRGGRSEQLLHGAESAHHRLTGASNHQQHIIFYSRKNTHVKPTTFNNTPSRLIFLEHEWEFSSHWDLFTPRSGSEESDAATCVIISLYCLFHRPRVSSRSERKAEELEEKKYESFLTNLLFYCLHSTSTLSGKGKHECIRKEKTASFFKCITFLIISNTDSLRNKRGNTYCW